MSEHFIAMLDSIHPQDEPVKELLRTNMFPKIYPRGHLLVRQGEINDRLYFIERGTARAYSLEEGEPVSMWFMMDGDVAMLPESFYDQVPSVEALEILEESKVWELKKVVLDTAYREYMCANIAGRVMEENAHKTIVKQYRELRVCSKFDRYMALVDRWPELLSRIPSKHIATFLGMHPKTLIRARKDFGRMRKR